MKTFFLTFQMKTENEKKEEKLEERFEILKGAPKELKTKNNHKMTFHPLGVELRFLI